MSSFKDFILNPLKEGIRNPNQGIPTPFEKFSNYTDYIKRGQIIAIGGKKTSGKQSLMDFVYMLNVYKWWKELADEDGEPIPDDQKPKIKMFYFNMRTTAKLKFQKWLCLYLKLAYDVIIDIPTLTSSKGKLIDLADSEYNHIQQKIVEARAFFEEFEEDVLTMINGQQTPSAINNTVKDYMDSIGKIDDHGVYELDPEHIGQYTFVYIDNTDRLVSEVDGISMMNEEGLKKKLSTYLVELRDTYSVTSTIIVPSRVTNSRMVKDSEPTYKELGIFSKFSDIGIIVYNPFNENNNNYCGYPIEKLVFNGKIRFRTLTLVQNSKGPDNITVGAFFLGEMGYFRESPSPLEEERFEEFISVLRQLP